MMDAPSAVDDKQLRELRITVKHPPKKEEK